MITSDSVYSNIFNASALFRLTKLDFYDQATSVIIFKTSENYAMYKSDVLCKFIV